MTTKAVYPGTFDPITYGHIDVISRASRLFDHVIIAIGTNQGKSPLFSANQRITLVEQVIVEYKNVTVQTFDGLLIDFVKAQQANVIIRGIRNVTDLDYECRLTSMNRTMAPNIETLFLMPLEKYMYVSSSLVREIVALGGDVSAFVPKQIIDHLKQRKNL